MKPIFLLVISLVLFNSCDTFKGATMNIENINIPIEKIYFDIKENNNIFNYEDIALDYQPSHESFEIFPKWGKQISKPYYYVHIWVYGFGATIKYIDSDLYSSALYLHGAPKDILEFTEFKINELKIFFQDYYGLKENDIKISVYK
jgi:hypothetical protein